MHVCLVFFLSKINTIKTDALSCLWSDRDSACGLPLLKRASVYISVESLFHDVFDTCMSTVIMKICTVPHQMSHELRWNLGCFIHVVGGKEPR